MTPRATARSIAEKKPRVVSSHATMKNSTWTNVVAVSISAAIASIEPCVVAEQGRAVAADRGERGELEVLVDDALEPARPRRGLRWFVAPGARARVISALIRA